MSVIRGKVARHHAPLRSRRTDGYLTIEALFTLLLTLGAFSFAMQTADLYSAGLVVQSAASSAVRRAETALAICPADIEGAPLYSVDYSARAQDNDRLLRLLEAYDVSDGSEQPIRNAIGGPRLQLIRDAASARLLAVAPDPGDITGRGASSFWSSVGGGVPEDRAPFAAAIYNRVAMAVTFQRPDGEAYSLGGRQAIQFGPDEDLCVKVTYLLHCTAPLVSGFFCDTYASIRASRPQSALDSLAAARRSGDPDRIRRTTATLRSAERDIRRQSGYLDALEYAEAPWAGWLFDDRARFRVITSHACGRLQGGTHDPCAEGA